MTIEMCENFHCCYLEQTGTCQSPINSQIDSDDLSLMTSRNEIVHMVRDVEHHNVSCLLSSECHALNVNIKGLGLSVVMLLSIRKM